MPYAERGLKRLADSALRKIAVRTSITMMKSRGKRGSPYRRPRPCQKLGLAQPLTRTWVLAVERSSARCLSQCGPKPRYRRTSKRNCQETESKAFAMSILKRMAGTLRWCSVRIDCWTSIKLYKIDRPAMNVLWFVSTREGITGVSSEDSLG